MLGADSDEMKFLSIDDAKKKDAFLKDHPRLANKTVGNWYLTLATTRITIFSDYPDAIRWARCAVSIGIAIGDRALTAEALCASGDAFLKLREGDLANATFLQAIAVAGANQELQKRASEGIRIASSLPRKRTLASESGALGQLLSIIDDKLVAAQFVGYHPELKNKQVVQHCIEAAEDATKLREWDKAAQYGRAGHILARAIGDHIDSIKASCLSGDALCEMGDTKAAASEYFGAMSSSWDLSKAGTLSSEIKSLVEHAGEMYKKTGK